MSCITVWRPLLTLVLAIKNEFVGMNKKAWSQTATTIDLLRHGECEGGEIYRGSTDVSLSENGWRQMGASVEAEIALHGSSPWQKIITSPLQRCRQFADCQAQAWGVPVCVNDAFREMHFGDWEGRTIQEVWQTDHEAVTKFYADPGEVSPPNGESMALVQERLLPAWQEVITQHPGQHLLLVQHGGTIRVLLSWLLQMPLTAVTRLEIPYASLSRVKVFDDGEEQFPRLVFLNRAFPSTNGE